MAIDRRKYLYRIKRLEIKSWLKYLMIEGKSVVDYVLGELMTGTDITIDNTVEKKFYKFDIKGNSVQDGTPTPETEVPILSSGDNGTISEKIVNKNLFDYANSTIKTGYAKDADGNEISTGSGNYTTSYTKVMPNTTYTFSADLTSAVYRLYFYDKNKNWISRTGAISNSIKHYTFTTPSNCYYIQFQNVKGYATNNEAQLELGSATTYVAHQEQTYTIPVQQPMRSIGDVRDEFIKVNGNWFERHNIEHNIIKSDNNITVNTYGTNSYQIRLKNHLNENSKIFVLSNYFIGVSFDNRTTSTNNIIYSEPTKDIITVRNTEFTTLEDFKTWLDTKYTNGNPVYIDYVLETPTDLPCTSEQIAILENLPKSYNEQTNIYSIDTTPAYVEAQAYIKKEEV